MATAQAAAAPIDRKKVIERGDFTKERHERPERSAAEVNAAILRMQAEHPERLTIKPITADICV